MNWKIQFFFRQYRSERGKQSIFDAIEIEKSGKSNEQISQFVSYFSLITF